MELVDWRGDLQPLLEDSLLALEPDVLGPSDESAQVPGWLDVLADTKVPGALLKEGVDCALDHRLGDCQRGGSNLLSSLLLQ